MIVNPYKKIIQYTRISIESYHLNSDIRNNMKLVLKKKVEKKCNKNGYIDEVYRITEYSDGMLFAENLNGNVIYDITFHCKICQPIENTINVGQIKVINQELIISINGPIIYFIPKDKSNINIWNIYNGNNNDNTSQKLKSGDFIKINIYKCRINLNDTTINVIGELMDVASEDEINKYFGNKILNEEIISSVII